MNEENLENVIEKVNKDYLELLYSKEYRIGKRIIKLKETVKSFNLKELYRYYKSMRMQRRIKKIPNTKKIKETYYNKGKISNKDKCVVYSCITGNYDKVNEPMFKRNDFVLITDNNLLNSLWDKKDIPKDAIKLTGNKINRYCKMHPFEIFKDYDYSIYIDGNVQVVSDVRSLCELAHKSKCGIAMHMHPNRNCTYNEAEACIIYKRGNSKKIIEQMEKYKDEEFPENFGFLEATIIVCDLKNPVAKKIMDSWYDEFIRSDSGRDQLSLPYIIWKNGYTIEDIGILGNNLLFNPIFRVLNIGDHKDKEKMQ